MFWQANLLTAIERYLDIDHNEPAVVATHTEEEAKKRRVHLKGELYKMLVA